MSKDKKNQSLGEYINQRRVSRGLSLADAADLSGLHLSYWSKLEAGQYDAPAPKHLMAIARALDVNFEDLYGLAGYESPDRLPTFTPYLRAKYQLPPEAVADLERYFELLRNYYDIPKDQPVFPPKAKQAVKPTVDTNPAEGGMNPPVITKLRDMVPLRPLRYSEAIRLAELQAQKFLTLSGLTEPSVPSRIISDLPRVQVTRMSPFPTSGATHWSRGRWMVVLNGSEPATRQRFSLAHEAKHIIDHRFVRLTYGQFPASERADMIERICDYFAGCLLMPRPWVKRLYCSGMQHLPDLAQAFGVSQAAMSVRLSQIGLVERTPRCLPMAKDWTLKAVEEVPRQPLYQRTASYVT